MSPRELSGILLLAVIALIGGILVWKFSNFSNSATNSTLGNEIFSLSKDLYDLEIKRNDIRFYTINYQGKTQSNETDDKAPHALIHIINRNQFWGQSSTIRSLKRIFDKYPLHAPGNGPERMQAEWRFLEEVLRTRIMDKVMRSLPSKKPIKKKKHFSFNKYRLIASLISKATKEKEEVKEVGSTRHERLEFLRKIWFTTPDGNINIRGSGFEKVFMGGFGEDMSISGLHNWMYFAEQEHLHFLDYKGYVKYEAMSNKTDTSVAAVRFNFHNVTAPQNSLFIGTSPELEMSLYTACFVLNKKGKCSVELGGKRFSINVLSDTLKHNNEKYIIAAYPELD